MEKNRIGGMLKCRANPARRWHPVRNANVESKMQNIHAVYYSDDGERCECGGKLFSVVIMFLLLYVETKIHADASDNNELKEFCIEADRTYTEFLQGENIME